MAATVFSSSNTIDSMGPRFSFPLCSLVSLSLSPILTGIASAQTVGGSWETLAQFGGNGGLDNFGASVAGTGDIDGDGYPDFIIGAPLADPGGSLDAGEAYVISGRTGALIWRYSGQSGDHFGRSVAAAGDVDGDGVGDLVVGAPEADPGGLSDAGSVLVYSGATGALLWQFDGLTSVYSLGASVSGAGDVDGDGFGDILAGAPDADPLFAPSAGAVHLYSGATGALVWKVDGTGPMQRLGKSVSRAGDVNGDGYADFIIGHPGFHAGGVQDSGAAYLFVGPNPTPLWSRTGQTSNAAFGSSVSLAGDIDGDGMDDVIVGAADEAHVLSGDSGAPLWLFDSAAVGGVLSSPSVSGAGDVDGDGVGDLLLGSPGSNPGGVSASGSAYVVSGATGSVQLRIDGQQFLESLGSSVAGIGDLDGDGDADVVIGAAGGSYGGTIRNGTATVFSLDPFLHLSSSEISVAAATPVTAELHFPASEAGARYALLLSASGIGPSTVAGLAVPVTIDPLFNQWLGHPATVGTLDVNAHAQHQLALPPSTPSSAAGKVIRVAAATLDVAPLTGRMSSAVRYLTIVP